MRMPGTDAESGMALMETLVALTLVAIALLMIVSALVTGEASVESDKLETRPVFLSGRSLEQVERTPFASAGAAESGASPESAPSAFVSPLAVALPTVVSPPTV
jgi:hypothetical protein